MLPLLVSLGALAAPPPPAAALVQIDRAGVVAAKPLLRAVGGDEIAPELRIWRVSRRAAARLRRAGVVSYATVDRVRRATATPSDPLVREEWWRAAIGADRVDPPGPGRPITVVDSGLDITHPEFAGRPNTTLLNEQTVGSEDEGHGTEVSSVIAAPANGVGIVGVYPQADLRSWDASPNGFLSDGAAIQGILEASRRGPGVINLSFGGRIDNPLLEQAVLVAVRRGSLVVAASGNEGAQGSPESFPADYAHVLTVAATNELGALADFSSASPYVDLAAPGTSIPVAEPQSRFPSGYARASGTSFSAPLVSGAAAWVWTVRPELDAGQVFELVRRSARDIGPTGFDNGSGYGLLDIPAALSFPAPVRDPLEPNDDADQIEAGRLFAAATAPLTTPRKLAQTVTARVDAREDPHDFYRVYAPANRRVTATTSGAVDLRFYRRSARPLRGPALATSARAGTATERVSYVNRGSRATYVYAEVRPGRGVREATYTLRITTPARR